MTDSHRFKDGDKFPTVTSVDSPEEIAARELEALLAHTKQKAYNLIVAVIPEWKQRNYAARAVELQEIRFESGTLTLSESTELQSIRDVFVDQVKPIRSASDFIETEIVSGKITTTDQIDNHIAWEA